MGKKVTLGGDRVGSGNRMKQELHNYFRSNHNLSCARITSAAPGVLYPLYTNIGLTGDTFDIDLNAFVRTLPTEGPMFGAFKMQVDVFSADFRLYQAILHNNTTEIGMDMDKVLLPKIELRTKSKWVYDETVGKFKWKQQISKSSLMYYLGLSGIARHTVPLNEMTVNRKLNALPVLAYYDIFKNYYSNKQEENAYVIAGKSEKIGTVTGNIQAAYFAEQGNGRPEILDEIPFADINVGFTVSPNVIPYIFIEGTNLLATTEDNQVVPTIRIARASSETPSSSWAFIGTYTLLLDNEPKTGIMFEYIGTDTTTDVFRVISTPQQGLLPEENTSIKLNAFPLKNIDEMRKRLLTKWDLGEEYVIDENEDLMPYNTLTNILTNDADNADESANIYPMQGLVVKCYQSDIFNNWLDSEWVAKISEYSKVNVTNGSFTMDALNLAKKMYNHYNRVAITGGTYDDWQLAAYGEENYGKSEKPIYHGGMSSEVIFDEVVSTAQTADEPLGSLGGRGTLKGNRGGHVIIKCKEATVIMVMVSLTPRLTYTQGNAWYLTELESIDDLHKPEFDRIGFQDLLQERLAWWGAQQTPSTGMIISPSIGKQPAWIEYQTDVDKCYGDFAEEDGKGFMVLQRLYDFDESTKGVKDITTYIDPSKYNYPFAVNSLTAQNFWIFLNLDIKARRKMSAKQIPNF